MTAVPEWPSAKGSRILSLVGHDMTIEPRARKTARSLVDRGFSVVVLAHDDKPGLLRQEWLGDALIHRVPVRANGRLSPRLARLSVAEMVERLRHETELQRQRLQMMRRDFVAGETLRSRADPLKGLRKGINGVMRRLRFGEATRVRVIRSFNRRFGVLSSYRWRNVRRVRVIAVQRRFQITGAAFRAAVRLQAKVPGVRRAWRRDLPEMITWEAALGPIVDSLEPELIHVHDIFHLGLAVRAKARAERAGRSLHVVYDAHELIAGLPGPSWRREALLSLEREYIEHVDAVVTVSQSLADELERAYGVTPSLVLNAPDRAAFEQVMPLREVAGLGAADVVIAYVGGLAPDRGAEVLIDSLRYLADDHHVVFVTNAVGGYRTTLELVAADKGIGDRVHFVSYVPSDAVVSYISGVDVTVAPLSRKVMNYEVALPNKLFQSLHARVPVVVSDNPEMDRFVRKHGVGVSFPGGDSGALAGAIQRVLNERDAFVAAIDRPGFLDAMSWDAQVDHLLNRYHALEVVVR